MHLSSFRQFFRASDLKSIRTLLHCHILPTVIINSDTETVTLFQNQVIVLQLYIQLCGLILQLIYSAIFLILINSAGIILTVVTVVAVVIIIAVIVIAVIIIIIVIIITTVVIIIIVIIIIAVIIIIIPVCHQKHPFQTFHPCQFRHTGSHNTTGSCQPDSHSTKNPRCDQHSFCKLLHLTSSFLFL